ncbi:MAG: phosphate regulon sensor histidine kinase PhoR [Pseudomonadota bacterium]
MNPFVKAEISQVIGIFLISSSIGYLFNQLPTLLMLGLLVYSIKHAFHLTTLANRVIHSRQITYPYPLGIWGLIYQELDKQRSRSRKRKRTLNRYTSRFRKVASAIPDAYILIDKSASVEWANLAAKHLLQVNWPRDEGVELTKLVANPELTDYLETPDYSRSLEFPSPLNKATILSLRITPFGSKKSQRLVVTRNITDLYNLNQTRRDFVSNVSHELRTPLTVITGFLENLSDNNPQPFQERPFTLMLQQAERMNTIISDLLTLSKLEMGQKPSIDQPVPVPELIASIIDQAVALADQKGGYTIDHSLDTGLWLVGNTEELQSAFSNLIFNAIIHTPAKTEILITWKKVDGKAVFNISDTGPGIPERHIPRLTERFYRVDKGRSRQSGGTGLGLAIVKHIINRHDGELMISSKEAFGSQFTCRFPESMILEGKCIRETAIPPT